MSRIVTWSTAADEAVKKLDPALSAEVASEGGGVWVRVRLGGCSMGIGSADIRTEHDARREAITLGHRLDERARIAKIGPITKDLCRKKGWEVSLTGLVMVVDERGEMWTRVENK